MKRLKAEGLVKHEAGIVPGIGTRRIVNAEDLDGRKDLMESPRPGG